MTASFDVPEEWRMVVGNEWYEISNFGTVRRAKPGRSTYVGRVLKWKFSHRGYPYVCLSAPDRRYGRVHVMVCEAFHGPRPPGLVVRHLDGDPGNPNASNLAWGSRGQNSLDSVAHKTHAYAKRDRCSQGHVYTPETTYLVRWQGTAGVSYWRNCRICKSEEYVKYPRPSQQLREKEGATNA